MSCKKWSKSQSHSKSAAERDHQKILKIFLPLSNPDASIKSNHNAYSTYVHLRYLCPPRCISKYLMQIIFLEASTSLKNTLQQSKANNTYNKKNPLQSVKPLLFMYCSYNGSNCLSHCLLCVGGILYAKLCSTCMYIDLYSSSPLSPALLGDN